MKWLKESEDIFPVALVTDPRELKTVFENFSHADIGGDCDNKRGGHERRPGSGRTVFLERTSWFLRCRHLRELLSTKTE